MTSMPTHKLSCRPDLIALRTIRTTIVFNFNLKYTALFKFDSLDPDSCLSLRESRVCATFTERKATLVAALPR